MSNCAKVSITGRLTRDPESKNWQGTTVVSFTVAVNTTKKEGEKYIADFYNVSVWGKSGEFILPKLAKGSLVQVYGDLILQPYTDKKTNTEKQSLSVRATDVIPLSPSAAKKESNDEAPAPAPAPSNVPF